ncbi:hypothetical protein [Jeotgalibacillus malaysiensis]|uniref:hypothetical protein n=1 Tax=Jeotgalibacillus malaysiensis TaxID=1508404 RepID=UPI00384CF123
MNIYHEIDQNIKRFINDNWKVTAVVMTPDYLEAIEKHNPVSMPKEVEPEIMGIRIKTDETVKHLRYEVEPLA